MANILLKQDTMESISIFTSRKFQNVHFSSCIFSNNVKQMFGVFTIKELRFMPHILISTIISVQPEDPWYFKLKKFLDQIVKV